MPRTSAGLHNLGESTRRWSGAHQPRVALDSRGGAVLKEVLFALAASLCTATSSIAQRRAAAPAPGELSFNWRLIGFLVHRPVWFLGILAMVAGFVFQVAALRVGTLITVQLVIATELLFVFGFLAVQARGRVHARDWLAAVGMAAGLGVLLLVARPRGGQSQAPAHLWAAAAVGTFLVAGLMTFLAYVPVRHRPPSPARKAALLAVAAGVAFGFVAAVVKELSNHLGAGPVAVFSNWSPYVLVASGAAAMFLASNAFQAGTLAASQPALTIVDPIVASLLGVLLFGDVIQHSPRELVGEALALAVLVASVVMLSRSPLVRQGLEPIRPNAPPGTGAPGQPQPGGGREPLEEDSSGGSSRHDTPIPASVGPEGKKVPEQATLVRRRRREIGSASFPT